MCKLEANCPTTAATPLCYHTSCRLPAVWRRKPPTTNCHRYLVSHTFRHTPTYLLGVWQPRSFATPAVITPIISHLPVNTTPVIHLIKSHINHPFLSPGDAVYHTPQRNTHRVIRSLDPQHLSWGLWYTLSYTVYGMCST